MLGTVILLGKSTGEREKVNLGSCSHSHRLSHLPVTGTRLLANLRHRFGCARAAVSQTPLAVETEAGAPPTPRRALVSDGELWFPFWFKSDRASQGHGSATAAIPANANTPYL